MALFDHYKIIIDSKVKINDIWQSGTMKLAHREKPIEVVLGGENNPEHVLYQYTSVPPPPSVCKGKTYQAVGLSRNASVSSGAYNRPSVLHTSDSDSIINGISADSCSTEGSTNVAEQQQEQHKCRGSHIQFVKDLNALNKYLTSDLDSKSGLLSNIDLSKQQTCTGSNISEADQGTYNLQLTSTELQSQADPNIVELDIIQGILLFLQATSQLICGSTSGPNCDQENATCNLCSSANDRYVITLQDSKQNIVNKQNSFDSIQGQIQRISNVIAGINSVSQWANVGISKDNALISKQTYNQDDQQLQNFKLNVVKFLQSVDHGNQTLARAMQKGPKCKGQICNSGRHQKEISTQCDRLQSQITIQKQSNSAHREEQTQTTGDFQQYIPKNEVVDQATQIDIACASTQQQNNQQGEQQSTVHLRKHISEIEMQNKRLQLEVKNWKEVAATRQHQINRKNEILEDYKKRIQQNLEGKMDQDQTSNTKITSKVRAQNKAQSRPQTAAPLTNPNAAQRRHNTLIQRQDSIKQDAISENLKTQDALESSEAGVDDCKLTQVQLSARSKISSRNSSDPESKLAVTPQENYDFKINDSCNLKWKDVSPVSDSERPSCSMDCAQQRKATQLGQSEDNRKQQSSNSDECQSTFTSHQKDQYQKQIDRLNQQIIQLRSDASAAQSAEQRNKATLAIKTKQLKAIGQEKRLLVNQVRDLHVTLKEARQSNSSSLLAVSQPIQLGMRYTIDREINIDRGHIGKQQQNLEFNQQYNNEQAQKDVMLQKCVGLQKALQERESEVKVLLQDQDRLQKNISILVSELQESQNNNDSQQSIIDEGQNQLDQKHEQLTQVRKELALVLGKYNAYRVKSETLEGQNAIQMNNFKQLQQDYSLIARQLQELQLLYKSATISLESQSKSMQSLQTQFNINKEELEHLQKINDKQTLIQKDLVQKISEKVSSQDILAIQQVIERGSADKEWQAIQKAQISILEQSNTINAINTVNKGKQLSIAISPGSRCQDTLVGQATTKGAIGREYRLLQQNAELQNEIKLLQSREQVYKSLGLVANDIRPRDRPHTSHSPCSSVAAEHERQPQEQQQTRCQQEQNIVHMQAQIDLKNKELEQSKKKFSTLALVVQRQDKVIQQLQKKLHGGFEDMDKLIDNIRNDRRASEDQQSFSEHKTQGDEENFNSSSVNQIRAKSQNQKGDITEQSFQHQRRTSQDKQQSRQVPKRPQRLNSPLKISTQHNSSKLSDNMRPKTGFSRSQSVQQTTAPFRPKTSAAKRW